MQHLLKITLILLQLLIIQWSTAENSQPYCYKNITETSYRVVTKTRIKYVSSKNIFKKIISKKDTQVELYQDQEPVYKIKVQRLCCEGYKMDEYNLCEPQCVKNGCPQHSKCVEPEVCACKKGYFSVRSSHDGKHYCEPICEKPCPENSECVGPNQCACKKHYNFIQGTCRRGFVCVAPNKCYPVCSLGDQCQNGRCVSPNRCICNAGFIWNSELLVCEESSIESSTDYTFTTEFSPSTESSMEVETDIETYNDDIDPNQVFNENIETTTFDVTDEYGSSTTSPLEANQKCPSDYVFYRGICRALKFVSNEIDCWQKPCLDKNAVCLENGTCACKEGFKWFTTFAVDHNSLDKSIKSVCLTAVEYESRLLYVQQISQKDDITKPANWTMIFFIIMGVSIMVAALVFLGVKLFYRQTGEIDVEGKNLACTYDNRVCSEMDKSVI